MGGQFGVEQTKKGLDLVFAAVAAVQAAKADGQINLSDAQYLVPVLLAAGPALADVKMYPKELGEMDEKDGAELLAYAAVRLPGLVGVDLAVKVNAALKVLVAAAELVGALKGHPVLMQVPAVG